MMKKISEEEAQKAIDEMSADLKDATKVFEQSFRAYVDAFAKEMRIQLDKAKVGGNFDSQKFKKNFAPMSQSFQDAVRAIVKHRTILQKTGKVVIHKNEVKAYDRMLVVLDRMKKEAQDFKRTSRKLLP